MAGDPLKRKASQLIPINDQEQRVLSFSLMPLQIKLLKLLSSDNLQSIVSQNTLSCRNQFNFPQKLEHDNEQNQVCDLFKQPSYQKFSSTIDLSSQSNIANIMQKLPHVTNFTPSKRQSNDSSIDQKRRESIFKISHNKLKFQPSLITNNENDRSIGREQPPSLDGGGGQMKIKLLKKIKLKQNVNEASAEQEQTNSQDKDNSNEVVKLRIRKRIPKGKRISIVSQSDKREISSTAASSQKCLIELTPVRNRFIEVQNKWIDIGQRYNYQSHQQDIRMLTFKRRIIIKNIVKFQNLWRELRLLKLKQSMTIKIQKYLRSFNIRTQIKSKKQKIIKIQSIIRMFMALKKFRLQKHSAIQIQSICKAYLLKRRYQMIRLKIIKIQSILRCQIMKRLYKKLRAAIMIQSFFRMYPKKKFFIQYITQKRKREAQQRLIEEQKRRFEENKKRKEAVRVIEKYWAFRILRKELREKRKQWANLPKDCRLLWMRFSLLKEQAFDLREEIRFLNDKKALQ